jgi:TetR/AcrR family fatty acid metabolism transcriptional regulator
LEIACEAGIAEGTIYLYFDNKDDLLLSVLEVKMKELLGHIQEVIFETDEALEQFECLLETYLKAFQKNPDLAAVLRAELRMISRFMHGYEKVELRGFLDLIGRIVEQGQRKGVIRADIPPTLIKHLVFGALDEVVSTWVIDGKQYRLEKLAQPIFDLFLRGIWVSPCSRPHHKPARIVESSRKYPGGRENYQ